MTLRMPAQLLDQVRREGERAYPSECCGAIAGPVDGDKRAARLYPVANRRTDDPHRYLIEAEQLRSVEREARANNWEILGFYHSHPDHPAIPSEFDTAHAWPWYSYLIVAVADGRAESAVSWVLDPDRPRMQEETLDVESEV
ncbi:MAG TPA: M67 family metallopeptidase [Gemmatimonadales bacterium]|nr:M67 family metallopeptidase [Gemmatimonadales bacterium]